MLGAGNGTFDQHGAAFLDGDGVGFFDFFPGLDVDEDAAPVVAVDRLDADRQTDVFGGVPGIRGAIDFAAFGNRHAAGGEQFLGQVLVARNGFGDGAGAVGFGRPDAAHCRAVADLHQIAVLEQADGRNVAVVGGIDDACGRRPQTLGIDHVAEFLDDGGDVERPVLDRRHDQVASVFQRGAGDLLMPGADGDFVHPDFGSFAGLAEAAGQAGQILQFEGHMFEDVGGPGAFLDAAQETAAFPVAAAVLDQRGQQGGQALVEAGNLVRGEVFQFADIDPGFQHRPVGPDIRAAQGNDVADDDVFFLHAWFARLRLAVRNNYGAFGDY